MVDLVVGPLGIVGIGRTQHARWSDRDGFRFDVEPAVEIVAGTTGTVQATLEQIDRALDVLEGDEGIVYFTKARSIDGIWAWRPSEGDPELMPVLKDIRRFRYWTLWRDQLFYVDPGDPPVLRRYDVRKRRERDVRPLDVRLHTGKRGISVSPDGKRLLYTDQDVQIGNVMLMNLEPDYGPGRLTHPR